MMGAVVAFVGAFALAVLLVGLGMAVAARAGFVSHPNPIVANHRRPVLLGGGVGLVVTILVIGFYFVGQGWLPARIPLGILLTLLLGVFDDISAIRPLYKLLLQGVAVIAYLWLTPGVCWLLPLWFVFLLGSQNAWNMVDIMDGLLAIVGATCLLAIAFMLHIIDPSNTGLSLLASVGGGAAAGFLVWNAPPARVYMGDAGSLSLGMLFGIVVVEASFVDPWLVVPMLVAGIVPWFEMVFLIIERTKKGIPFYRGSPDHFALRLLHRGDHVRIIVLRVFVVSLILGGIGVVVAAVGLTWPAVAIAVGVAIAVSLLAGRYFAALPAAEAQR